MVNDAFSGFAIAEAPHGGTGLSGWGRTHGKAGLLEMVHLNMWMWMAAAHGKALVVSLWPRSGKAADAFLRFEFAADSPRACAMPAAR